MTPTSTLLAGTTLAVALLTALPSVHAQQTLGHGSNPSTAGAQTVVDQSNRTASPAGTGKALLEQISPRRAACVKEGAACAAKESVCCAGLICVGFKQPVCMPNS
jgi:NaMN:DMB phosphoribosyltransferase